jgi:hypothetical protein
MRIKSVRVITLGLCVLRRRILKGNAIPGSERHGGGIVGGLRHDQDGEPCTHADETKRRTLQPSPNPPILVLFPSRQEAD